MQQINTSPITLFAQSLRAAELSNQKEVKLTIQQARLLNITLTEMLQKISQDYERLFYELKTSETTEVITVQMDGGSLIDPK